MPYSFINTEKYLELKAQLQTSKYRGPFCFEKMIYIFYLSVLAHFIMRMQVLKSQKISKLMDKSELALVHTRGYILGNFAKLDYMEQAVLVISKRPRETNKALFGVV